MRREKRHGSSAIVQFDNNIVIDYSSRVVFYRNAEINFTKKEFDIIEFLSQNKGIIFDRETIYEKVWGLDGSGDNSVITEPYTPDKNKIPFYRRQSLYRNCLGVRI